MIKVTPITVRIMTPVQFKQPGVGRKALAGVVLWLGFFGAVALIILAVVKMWQ